MESQRGRLWKQLALFQLIAPFDLELFRVYNSRVLFFFHFPLVSHRGRAVRHSRISSETTRITATLLSGRAMRPTWNGSHLIVRESRVGSVSPITEICSNPGSVWWERERLLERDDPITFATFTLRRIRVRGMTF